MQDFTPLTKKVDTFISEHPDLLDIRDGETDAARFERILFAGFNGALFRWDEYINAPNINVFCNDVQSNIHIQCSFGLEDTYLIDMYKKTLFRHYVSGQSKFWTEISPFFAADSLIYIGTCSPFQSIMLPEDPNLGRTVICFSFSPIQVKYLTPATDVAIGNYPTIPFYPNIYNIVAKSLMLPTEHINDFSDFGMIVNYFVAKNRDRILRLSSESRIEWVIVNAFRLYDNQTTPLGVNAGSVDIKKYTALDSCGADLTVRLRAEPAIISLLQNQYLSQHKQINEELVTLIDSLQLAVSGVVSNIINFVLIPFTRYCNVYTGYVDNLSDETRELLCLDRKCYSVNIVLSVPAITLGGI